MDSHLEHLVFEAISKNQRDVLVNLVGTGIAREVENRNWCGLTLIAENGYSGDQRVLLWFFEEGTKDNHFVLQTNGDPIFLEEFLP